MEAAKEEGTYKHMFTPYAIKVMEAAKEEGTRHCEVWWGGGNRYEVLRRGETDVVNIETKSCTCRKWELTGIPCAHAMACISKNRLQYDEYVDPFYSKETYLRTYNDIIQPMPGSNQYEVSGMVQPLPPKYIVQPGRPKKHARRREEGEEVPSKVKKIRIVGQTKCSNCGQPGHYRNKCSSPSMTPGSSGTKKQVGRPKNPATVVIGARKKKYIKKTSSTGVHPTTDTGVVSQAPSVSTPSNVQDLGSQSNVSFRRSPRTEGRNQLPRRSPRKTKEGGN